jgi:(+)-trans-carveol dehydrogenase/(-)-trans-carveol dehydrogenase
MSNRLTGKVALITGAARGQGRAEAVRFAEEGASLILVDLPRPIDNLPYAPSTKEDFDETVRLCEDLDARVHAAAVDTRDLAGLESAAREGAAELGGLDIIIGNAGIYTVGRLAVPDPVTGLDVLSEQTWQDMLDVNLTGVYNTVRAAAPLIVDQGRGGVILLTSSGAGLRGGPNLGHYVAAKHGVTGLAKSLAHELGPHWIRVNSIHPGQCNTAMIQNDTTYHLFRPDLEVPSFDAFREVSQRINTLPVPWVEPLDIANACVFLASDEARYITGVALPVDAGTLV